MIVKKYHKSTKEGFLKGFADIAMVTPYGSLTINGVTVFEKNGSRWTQFPQKATGEKTAEGKEKYFSHLYFAEREESNAFQDEFFKALADYEMKQGASVHANNVKEIDQVVGEVPF